jgi:hypothetical protein
MAVSPAGGTVLTKDTEQTKLIRTIPRGIDQEDYRTACCVVYGYFEERTSSGISSYYNVNPERVDYWWNYFCFEELASNKKRRGRKKNVLSDYIAENMGKEITIKEMAEKCEASMPTVYNYFNANRGFFKKITRGRFLVVDPSKERESK